MDTGTLEITEVMSPAGVVVVLAGQADVLNSGRLVEALMQRLPAGVTKLLVNTAQLAYIDSMALRALVMAARVLNNRDGKMTLIQPREAVLRLLTLTGADKYMIIQG